MYYFASDTHLGAGSEQEQRSTERLFVEWLERVSHDATAIFLCGDIFDFWYEYRRVVPRGFVRTLAKISEITERGVRVVFMVGNHDMWVRDYLTTECGMEIYTAPHTFELGGKKVHVAHGDNLNVKRNLSLRFMNSFFRSRVARVLFSWLIHPDIALWFGLTWSQNSRKGHSKNESLEIVERSIGYLSEYAMKHYAQHKDDIYIFGHIHHPLCLAEQRPQIVFMNDWSRDPLFASLSDEGELKLERVK
ncbi:MAG: UDP-2,3-diacylglucosamine diphosphatase [Rikenellaceae bacterium]